MSKIRVINPGDEVLVDKILCEEDPGSKTRVEVGKDPGEDPGDFQQSPPGVRHFSATGE